MQRSSALYANDTRTVTHVSTALSTHVASGTMCRGRGALLQALHTLVCLVSAITCGECAAPIAGGTCMYPPRLHHNMRRALRASSGGTRKSSPRLRHHVRRVLRAMQAPHTLVHLVSAIICGERCALICGRHTDVSASSPPSSAESATRFCGLHAHV